MTAFDRAVAALNQALAPMLEAKPAPGREWDPASWTSTGGVIDLEAAVRAVLGAVREPDEAMIDVVDDANADYRLINLNSAAHIGPAETWRAMIDALTSPGEG